LNADAVATAVAWPGVQPRGRILPPAAAAVVAVLAGGRAGVWELAAWPVAPLGELVKRVVNRPRRAPGRFNPTGGMPQNPSFPSSHVTEYVATFGFASWLLWHRRSRAAVPVAIASAGLIGLIGPSRVRTGDHRWSDVAGGYLLGAAYLGLIISLATRDERLRPAGPNQTEGLTAGR
jgi:membrane-associated phospholipid phosphatase